MLTNTKTLLSRIEKSQKQEQEQTFLDKLSIEQLQFAVESVIDPVGTKEKARLGSVQDIKNYYIATEAADLGELAVKGITGLAKAIFITYQLIKKLVKKVIDKIQDLKYRLKGFGQISDSDTRATNELLRNVGKVLPSYNKFKELDADAIKAIYKPEIKKFLISKDLDTPNGLVDAIATRIYSLIINLNMGPSARLLSGIGNIRVYNYQIMDIAKGVYQKKPFNTALAAFSVLCNGSIKEQEVKDFSPEEFANVLLVKKCNPEPNGTDRESLYESTIDILKNGRAHDLYRRTYQAVVDAKSDDLYLLELALKTLRDVDYSWINVSGPLREMCSILVSFIPKYLTAYSNTVSFSDAFFSVSKLIRTAKKEQGRAFGDTKLIGVDNA